MRGKVRFGFIHDRGSRDHPRLCGEKPLRHFPDTMRQGSPPPMRGKAYSDMPVPGPFGITPAYAGKREWFLHF